jgi:hypothetical protein
MLLHASNQRHIHTYMFTVEDMGFLADYSHDRIFRGHVSCRVKVKIYWYLGRPHGSDDNENAHWSPKVPSCDLRRIVGLFKLFKYKESARG